MNILLTDYCNRHCSFCFGGGYIKRTAQAGEFLTKENLDKILPYALENHDKVVTLLGGEPTMHPDVLEMIFRCREVGLNVQMFSNGIIPQNVLESLSEKTDPDWFNVTINYRHAKIAPQKEIEAVENSFRNLGARANVGATVYEKDQDLDYLWEAIDRFALRRIIRLGISNPASVGENDSISPDQMNIYGETIVRLSEQCEKREILLGFDCGFTPCMFTPDQFRRLFESASFPKLERCKFAIDVGPDMSVWPCFPLLKTVRVPLLDFKNLHDLREYFNEMLAPYFSFGMLGECPECKYFKKEKCQGGCIGYVVKSFSD